MTDSTLPVTDSAPSGQPRFLDTAACRLHPSWWVVDSVDEVEAYLICMNCRVRTDCRAYALNHPELSGIWAATTKEERAELRRRWQQPKAPPVGTARTAPFAIMDWIHGRTSAARAVKSSVLGRRRVSGRSTGRSRRANTRTA